MTVSALIGARTLRFSSTAPNPQEPPRALVVVVPVVAVRRVVLRGVGALDIGDAAS